MAMWTSREDRCGFSRSHTKNPLSGHSYSACVPHLRRNGHAKHAEVIAVGRPPALHDAVEGNVGHELAHSVPGH